MMPPKVPPAPEPRIAAQPVALPQPKAPAKRPAPGQSVFHRSLEAARMQSKTSSPRSRSASEKQHHGPARTDTRQAEGADRPRSASRRAAAPTRRDEKQPADAATKPEGISADEAEQAHQVQGGPGQDPSQPSQIEQEQEQQALSQEQGQTPSDAAPRPTAKPGAPTRARIKKAEVPITAEDQEQLDADQVLARSAGQPVGEDGAAPVSEDGATDAPADQPQDDPHRPLQPDRGMASAQAALQPVPVAAPPPAPDKISASDAPPTPAAAVEQQPGGFNVLARGQAAPAAAQPEDSPAHGETADEPGQESAFDRLMEKLVAAGGDPHDQSATPLQPGATISAPASAHTHAALSHAPAPVAPASVVEENHSNIVAGIRTHLLPHGGAMNIRLDPPELGALAVRVEMRDGALTASFETSNDDATRMLSHSLTQLKQTLESAGLSVEKLQVRQAPREHFSGQAGQDGSSEQRQMREQSGRQEQQRREALDRLWRKLREGSDPVDMLA